MQQCTVKRIPVSGTFELTSRCNFDCKMCYIHTVKEAGDFCGAEMGKRELTADEWIELGKTAKAHQMMFLLLTGGEPLIRKDFKEIYDGLYQMGLFVSINTNGSLWTQELIAWMKKRPPLQINVTLYGSSRETYEKLCGCPEAFDKVKENILRMKQAGFQVRLNVTVTRLNVQDINGILEFAKEHEFAVNGTSYLFPEKNCENYGNAWRLEAGEAGRVRARLMRSMCTPEELDWLLKKQSCGINRKPTDIDHKYPNRENIDSIHNSNSARKADRTYGQYMNCSAGKSSFWITWDGMMRACGTISSIYAECRDGKFSEAWNQIVQKTDTIQMPARCASCAAAGYCTVCGASALAEGSGDTEKMGAYICHMTEAYMKYLVENYFGQVNCINFEKAKHIG